MTVKMIVSKKSRKYKLTLLPQSGNLFIYIYGIYWDIQARLWK